MLRWPPRLLSATPALMVFALGVAVSTGSSLALSSDADRWVGAVALIIAGCALLLADLSRADDVRWRVAQIVVGGGCIASGLASAVGAG